MAKTAQSSKPRESASETQASMQNQGRKVMRAAQREINRSTDDFFAPFWDFQRQMNAVMEESFRNFSSLPNMWWGDMDKILPKVRVWEDDKAFHLETRLPTDNPENIQVAINDNVLTLEWHNEDSEEQDNSAFYGSQSSYRTVVIPDNANAEGAEAICKNGKLEVIVPKKKGASEKSRSVPVRTAA